MTLLLFFLLRLHPFHGRYCYQLNFFTYMYICLQRWFLDFRWATQMISLFLCLFVCWFVCFWGFFLHPGATPLSTAYFGKGNATILVRDFGCTGREETLQQCRPRNYSISSYYSYGYNVPNRYVHLTSNQLIISCYIWFIW